MLLPQQFAFGRDLGASAFLRKEKFDLMVQPSPVPFLWRFFTGIFLRDRDRLQPDNCRGEMPVLGVL